MNTLQEVGLEYRPRVIDASLHTALEISGAVIIEGARASGKTMTALNASSSYVFLDDPTSQELLEIAPSSLLDGPRPRLLDEWQLAPELWNLVRRKVDASANKGLFILTGSSVPPDDATRHTGAGRFLRLHQRTLSWWEKLNLPRDGVSISALFEGARPAASLNARPTLTDVVSLLLQSGFPAMTSLDSMQSARLLRAYINEVVRADIPRIADVRHDPEVIHRLIVSLARAVSSEAKISTLTEDVRSIAPSISVETISSYVTLLQRLFVVETQAAWSPKLRSRARLRTSPKFHLADPALAAAALGATESRLHSDLETLGLLFESAVVHDLGVYTSVLDGKVRHYRDSNGKEIDAIITLPDGRWAVVEVKVGGQQVAAATRSLNAAVSAIDTSHIGDPSFKLIITGTGPTLTLDDGTVTCPLSALQP